MAPFLGTFPGPNTYPGSTTFPGAPPAQMFAPPVFVNNTIPVAADLNALSAGIDNLATITLGRGTGLSKATGRNPGGRPAFKVYTASNQSIANIVTQIVTWDAAALDTEGGAQFVLNNSDRVTVWTAGWYRIKAQVAFPFGAANERAVNLHLNGTAIANIVASSNTATYIPAGSTSGNVRMQLSAMLHLPVGAQLYLSAYQASGAALDLLPAGQWGSWMAGQWINPY